MRLSRSYPAFIVAALAACGAEGGSGVDGDSAAPPAPARTPIGDPTGDLVTATIGAAGGTLASADGALLLEVPAGAVAEDVLFGIQPIANHAPGAMGTTAWRLRPEGVDFALPIRLTFRLTEEELAGTAPSFLRVVSQDAERHWRVHEAVTVANILVQDALCGDDPLVLCQYELVSFNGAGLPYDGLPRETWENEEIVTEGRISLDDFDGDGDGTWAIRYSWIEKRSHDELEHSVQFAGDYEPASDGATRFRALDGTTFQGNIEASSVSVSGFPFSTSNVTLPASMRFTR